MNPLDAEARAALVVAHPGHELRIYGWMEKAHPLVCVLSDGSGREAFARTESSVRTIQSSGARIGPIFGRWPDREIYAALLSTDHAKFLAAAAQLADALIAEKIDYVVCEAMEGHCSTHDVCRVLTAAAVREASRRSGCKITCYEFPLLGRHDVLTEEQQERAILLKLDDAALERKLAAARAYTELATEVEVAVTTMGEEVFRVESLRPFDPKKSPAPFRETPFYERHGERIVAEGRYENAIRYREHFLPLADALAELGV